MDREKLSPDEMLRLWDVPKLFDDPITVINSNKESSIKYDSILGSIPGKVVLLLSGSYEFKQQSEGR